MPTRLEGYIGNVFYHEVEMSTYPVFEFPLYTLALASKIVEVSRFEKLDLIHAHYAIPMPSVRISHGRSSAAGRASSRRCMERISRSWVLSPVTSL